MKLPTVRQNPIQRTVRTVHVSVLMIVYNFSKNITQNSSDNLLSYLQTTIIAQIVVYRRRRGTNMSVNNLP